MTQTSALLQFVLYQKPMLHIPKAIQWGRDNEDIAREKVMAIQILKLDLLYTQTRRD